MIRQRGFRDPKLYFVNEADGHYYFKQELILPESGFTKDDNVIYCARRTARIDAHRSLNARAVATSRLAEQLGIGDLVAKTEFATVTIDGEKKRGIRTAPISGTTHVTMRWYNDLRGYRPYYTPEAVRELTILVCFDFVCGQIDRHVKNIQLKTDVDLQNVPPVAFGEGKINILHVCAIDHDLSFGNLTYRQVRENVTAGLCTCPELLGEMQYPAVDMEFMQKVFSLEEATFKKDYADLLSDAEINAFFDRLEGFRTAVERQQEKEDALRTKGEAFFSRLLWKKEEYIEFLRRMEENAGQKNPDADFRFNNRPTYLLRDILTHKPYEGDTVAEEQKQE